MSIYESQVQSPAYRSNDPVEFVEQRGLPLVLIISNIQILVAG